MMKNEMKMIYTKRLATDEDNNLFIGAFAVDKEGREYRPSTATHGEPMGFVKIQLARSARETAMWSFVFPRKEMRAIHLHKFMSWAECQDFSGMSMDRILKRLRLGHDRAWVIGQESF